MNILKRYENYIKESVEDTDKTGEIILDVNGRKTTWFYLRDAILDGLFVESFDLTDDYVEEIFGNRDITTLEELTDLLDVDDIDDFESELSKMIIALDNDVDVEYVTIIGTSEDGDDIDLSYYNDDYK